MKTIIIAAITAGVIIAIVTGTLSYQQTYNSQCIADDGKVTGFLRCTKTFEDFLPNPITIDLEMGQVFQYNDLELEFYNIEDSRCPLDVTCIWEGKVTAMIHVRNQTHKIAGYFEPGQSVNYIVPYNVTLIYVEPHPISTEESEYVVTLEITELSKPEITNVMEKLHTDTYANVDGPRYIQSAPEIFSCASVGISRYSSYDLKRIENASGPLKFLELTDSDLARVQLIKKLIEDIGDRIEYHTHSYTTIPTENYDYIKQYLYAKFEEQYRKPFKSEYNAYVFYNGSTYSVNTSLQVLEYFPTKTLIMEIGTDDRNQSITITEEDFAYIPHIKTGIESIGRFEDSIRESMGVTESVQQEYIDYFEQKSHEQFGDNGTFNFIYNGKQYEPDFVIC